MVTYAQASKERLISFISSEIKDLFEKYLDYIELISDDDRKLKLLRSKILRNGNNAIRAISKEITDNYVVAYDPSVEYEEIIKIEPVKISRGE